MRRRDVYRDGLEVRRGRMAVMRECGKCGLLLTLLNDKEWSEWSDKAIADRVGVAQSFTTNVRASLISKVSDNPPSPPAPSPTPPPRPRTYINKHGKQSTMNTARLPTRSKTTICRIWKSLQSMMQVAEVFKTVNFTDLKIAPSALYKLAAPSTPEPVRTEIIAEVKAAEGSPIEAV